MRPAGRDSALLTRSTNAPPADVATEAAPVRVASGGTAARSVGRVEIPETTRHLDWRVGDPTGAELDEVRRVRDDIERRIRVLVAELEPTRADAAPAT